MITYQLDHQIHQLHTVDQLKPAQIAQALKLNEKTVAQWLARPHYEPRQPAKRASKLDPHKGTILRLLATHPYPSAQRLPRLREQGYPGGYSILKEFVRQVRPAPAPAFFNLAVCPGGVRPGGLGAGGLCPGGQHPPPLALLHHGAGLQPPDVRGVYPGRKPRTLPSLSPARL